MKNALFYVCSMTFLTSFVSADEVGDNSKTYLRDTDSITNVFSVELPTLSFKKDITLPNNSELYFQDGKQITLDKLDKSKAHCSLSGIGNTSWLDNSTIKNEHTIKSGDRLLIMGPLTQRDVKFKLKFDTEAMRISGVESKRENYSFEMTLNKNIAVATLDDALFRSGKLTKTVFADAFNEKSSFSGSLKCSQFAHMPTTGEIRAVLGTNNISIMPDISEPQSLKGGQSISNYEEDPKEEKEAIDFLTNSLNEQLKNISRKNSIPNIVKAVKNGNIFQSNSSKIIPVDSDTFSNLISKASGK